MKADQQPCSQDGNVTFKDSQQQLLNPDHLLLPRNHCEHRIKWGRAVVILPSPCPTCSWETLPSLIDGGVKEETWFPDRNKNTNSELFAVVNAGQKECNTKGSDSLHMLPNVCRHVWRTRTWCIEAGEKKSFIQWCRDVFVSSAA